MSKTLEYFFVDLLLSAYKDNAVIDFCKRFFPVAIFRDKLVKGSVRALYNIGDDDEDLIDLAELVTRIGKPSAIKDQLGAIKDAGIGLWVDALRSKRDRLDIDIMKMRRAVMDGWSDDIEEIILRNVCSAFEHKTPNTETTPTHNP